MLKHKGLHCGNKTKEAEKLSVIKSQEDNFEDIIAEGANEVIKNLLEKDEELIQDVTLEEIGIDVQTPKKYYNECEKCGFISNAHRRYLALKQLSTHKVNCSEKRLKKKCLKCEYVSSDIVSMKRHMRDEYQITTDTGSFQVPPPVQNRSNLIRN